MPIYIRTQLATDADNLFPQKTSVNGVNGEFVHFFTKSAKLAQIKSGEWVMAER